MSSRKRRPRSRAQALNDLGKMAAHLMEKSNQLHSAHVHQTMAFYTRLKDYIAFISKPSVSPSDARVKQQMADKILGLMRAEENKLIADQRPIGNDQLFICFINHPKENGRSVTLNMKLG